MTFKGIIQVMSGEIIRNFLVILLLFLYTLGNTEFETLHLVIHPDDSLAHTANQEKDSCHRAIYHNEPEEGCSHKSHVLLKVKCGLCDQVCHSDQVHFTIIQSAPLEFAELSQKYNQSFFLTSVQANLIPRAPPALS
ncbi:MAG TPA: hypothetical protein VGA21_11030 [Cyclobacteriaceae bacterium]|jgi:hypothetical protein